LVQGQAESGSSVSMEPEFWTASYGFRPGRNAHDALQGSGGLITREHTQWVVEADIKGFFDHVNHDYLMRFLEYRIKDPIFLSADPAVSQSRCDDGRGCGGKRAGDPARGLVSPVLANIYLHYVLDLWFEKRFTKTCRGRAFLVRYADDFIGCFTHEEDARLFLKELTERLCTFDLEIEPTKTAILRFGGRTKEEKPSTFSFWASLTIQERVVRSLCVGRKTEGKRVRKKLKQVKRSCASSG